MGVTEVFAGIHVRDRAIAIEFYERLLGAPPAMLPNEDEAAWQIVGPGWLYVLVEPEKAGASIVTLLVDDLDDRVAELTARGVETGPLQEIPHAVRSVWIADPDGNRIQIAQPLEPERARA